MEFSAGKYRIRFTEKRYGYNYYLAFAKFGELGEHTYRDAKSQYIFMEQVLDPLQAKIWHLVPMGNNEYQLCFEENGMRYHLAAQSYYPADKRDHLSIYVSAHHEAHQGNLRWHLHQEGGHVRITMAQHEYGLHGYELNCHEYYKHSDIMRKTQGLRYDQTLHHSDKFWNCMVHKERQSHHWILEPVMGFIEQPMQMAQQAMQFAGQAMEQMMGMVIPGAQLPTGKYHLSAWVPYKDQNYYLCVQLGGELGDKTNRDANSQFVFADNQQHKASVWEVIYHPENNNYTIKSEHQGRMYHLCAHDFYPTDKRDQCSKYVNGHTIAQTENAHWHIKQREQEYLISVAGQSFGLHGWHLCCQAFYKHDKIYQNQMKRCDYVQEYNENALNCFVHQDPNQQGIRWRFTPANQQQQYFQPQQFPIPQPQPDYQQYQGPHQGVVAPGKYYIKLHGKHSFLSLITEGEIGQCTFRDYNSSYVILEPYKNKIWEIEKHQDNTYKIHCHHNGKNYYLCCHSFYPQDDRDINSKYILVHNDQNQQNTKWHIRHKHGGFEICQAEKNFNLEEWSLGAHQFYEFNNVQSGSMKRCDFVLQNSKEYINCIVHKNKSEPNLVWELEQAHGEQAKQPFQEPYQQQQQFPQQQFPQQQFPQQQFPIFPGQQPPFQGFPGQQPPFQQQFPGQQPPPYPGQQMPYPGQQPPFQGFPNYPPYPGQQF